ncbi:MAG: class I SAM-dependent methyltransferase [Candidatus Pacebacteria bacterium]|nr:class I SAM-dependent methyltransferase [Candidatus Paceibacterota bacterium]
MSKKIWDKFANKYEEEVLSLTKVPQRKKQILAVIKKGRVLNLGTGSVPYLNRELIRQKNKVTATDFSKKMLEVAVHLFSHPNLEYKLADSRNLPFSKGTFDTVVSVNSILPEKRKEVYRIVKEVYRVLKPKGRFVAFLPSFEAVIELMKIYNTKPRFDKKEFRVFDSGQWQCFHTKETINKIMKEVEFKKYKVKKVINKTKEEVKQIKKIYGIDTLKYPTYHHFLIAEK